MTDPDSPGAPEPANNSADASVPIELTAQQRALYFALLQKSRQLAQMYLGGLATLTDLRNPDAVALAAHAFRELMEKIPEYLEVPMQAHRESLRVQVNVVIDGWSGVRKIRPEPCRDWKGEIDGSLRKFFGLMDGLVTWAEAHLPRRRQEVVGVLRRMDPSGREVPAPLQDLNVERWGRVLGFFQAVAHHRKLVTRDECAQWVDDLERFLLDRLRPRTFAEFEGIDALIRSGEGRD